MEIEELFFRVYFNKKKYFFLFLKIIFDIIISKQFKKIKNKYFLNIKTSE
jgi:hypothetical protein